MTLSYIGKQQQWSTEVYRTLFSLLISLAVSVIAVPVSVLSYLDWPSVGRLHGILVRAMQEGRAPVRAAGESAPGCALPQGKREAVGGGGCAMVARV